MNFMSLKKKRDAEKASAAAGKTKHTAGELRMQKDMGDLSIGDIAELRLHEEGKLMDFDIIIAPQGGIYKGGTFIFTFHVSADYPHKPPKVLCKTRVYHPNIDLEGNVCLNVLREEWKPVLNINTIVYGLNHLFVDPNVTDPLNKDAARMMDQDKDKFERLVHRSITSGCTIEGELFPPCRTEEQARSR